VGLGLPAPGRHLADSQEYIQRELGHLPADTRHNIGCENAAKLYRFVT
jgi:predicted TIM-barrel fold metal-dependent hydrolase